MNPNKIITKREVTAAYILAIAVDLIQLPITAGFLTAIFSMPLEAFDILTDIVTAVAVSKLLGFHPVLLPTFVLESIPVLDAAPTWTGCVAFVLWRRKRQGRIVRDPVAIESGEPIEATLSPKTFGGVKP